VGLILPNRRYYLEVQLILHDEGLVIKDKRFFESRGDGRVFGLRFHYEAEVVDQSVLGGGLEGPLAVVLGDHLVSPVLGGLGANPLLLEHILETKKVIFMFL
jgi:hypothetical protein